MSRSLAISNERAGGGAGEGVAVFFFNPVGLILPTSNSALIIQMKEASSHLSGCQILVAGLLSFI